jgi:hypothetical protein
MTGKRSRPAAEFTLKLKALPDSRPPAVRLRQLLKYALRAVGLQCVSVEEVRDPGDGELLPPPRGKPGVEGLGCLPSTPAPGLSREHKP